MDRTTDRTDIEATYRSRLVIGVQPVSVIGTGSSVCGISYAGYISTQEPRLSMPNTTVQLRKPCTKFKVLLCNIPVLSKPDNFPPSACTTIYRTINSLGHSVEFLDIDLVRPSKEWLLQYLRSGRYDIVGISSVVSTGYSYTKYLSNVIRDALPKATIVVGGNLAVSYEVLLNKCPIDICCLGEGDVIFPNILKMVSGEIDISSVNGIAYKKDGVIVKALPERLKSRFYLQEPDYSVIDKFSDIKHYIFDPLIRGDFAQEVKSYETAHLNKKCATIFTSKGCVNNCSFCHRFIGGYRTIPVNTVFRTIDELIKKYNVGFFCICDECFGEDSRWLREFIDRIRPLNVLFQIGGARVSILRKDPEILRKLREVGLVAIYFGMESGSNKILKNMRKNATVKDNLLAIRKCKEARVYTVIQLVLGVVGENLFTIIETAWFIFRCSIIMGKEAPLSINYLQALPGTESYSILKERGLLGDEEEYLLNISSKNADYKQYKNISGCPRFIVRIWGRVIVTASKMGGLWTRLRLTR